MGWFTLSSSSGMCVMRQLCVYLCVEVNRCAYIHFRVHLQPIKPMYLCYVFMGKGYTCALLIDTLPSTVNTQCCTYTHAFAHTLPLIKAHTYVLCVYQELHMFT